jgi:hypothetical protein
VLRRHQPREHREAAGVQHDVVVPAAELDAAHLEHAHPPAFGTVLVDRLLQVDHAVRDAVQLLVGVAARPVVQQHHRAALVGKEFLERQHLAPVAQRVLRQQPHLGQAVEHHALRPQLLDGADHPAHGFTEFDLGRMQDGLFQLGAQAFAAHQLEQFDALKAPAVRSRDGAQFSGRLRQRDVQALLLPAHAFQQKVQAQRGLSRTRIALDEVHMVAGKAAAQDVVQPGDAGASALLNGKVVCGYVASHPVDSR